MKAQRAHVALAAILVGSLIANGRTGELPIERNDIDAAIISVARSHNLTFRQPTTVGNGSIEALAFTSAECGEPIRIALLPVMFEQTPLLQALEPAGRKARYFYYGRSWDVPSRAAVFWQRKKQRALAAIGLTPYVPSEYMLFVDAPRTCIAAGAIDWRSVWNRDFLAAVRSAGRPGEPEGR